MERAVQNQSSVAPKQIALLVEVRLHGRMHGLVCYPYHRPACLLVEP
jgi:hypothetical protein